MPLEDAFDPAFTGALALREKQIQQNYRPIIGVHKWFARRPGSVFRNLLLAEFNGSEPADSSYWRAHHLRGVIADPFMGGGTPIFEANRLGFSVVGADVNPMAYWVVRQSLVPLDLDAFTTAAAQVSEEVEARIGELYRTRCLGCGEPADVKYFLWVKVETCPVCSTENDLFPGYLLAKDSRHPANVLACAHCGELNECTEIPTSDRPTACNSCGKPVLIEGPASRSRITCRACRSVFRYPSARPAIPRHRMWAIEYHCARCKPGRQGRFFKKPDGEDLARVSDAAAMFVAAERGLPIPPDPVPAGDETDRLHRWGYTRFRDMFSDRQLLALGLLLKRIREVPDREVRHALLTVFSDFLRYQNMLCRYDTYALKCQDIFSVHGFPVGLVQCENNVLGIPRVGSGSFRHFVEKYKRAKAYCQRPFETRFTGTRKTVEFIEGERIVAEVVRRFPSAEVPEAQLAARPATEVPLPPASLDGVFTDPPYFANVQYAELMDFCYAWLRQALSGEFDEFTGSSTRSDAELTGNTTAGRDLANFTAGLSAVFAHYAAALKPGAPFVFTYHHNESSAYVPLVVAILDAGLDCTAALPAPAEMGASLHIAGTGSSTVDTVFVCRRSIAAADRRLLAAIVASDVDALQRGGVRATRGDVRCLRAGHVARLSINRLRAAWSPSAPLTVRMELAARAIAAVQAEYDSPEHQEGAELAAAVRG